VPEGVRVARDAPGGDEAEEEAGGEQRPRAYGGGWPMFGLGRIIVHDSFFRETAGCYRVAAVVRKPNAAAWVEFDRCPC
jgi:hypothetical protein